MKLLVDAWSWAVYQRAWLVYLVALLIASAVGWWLIHSGAIGETVTEIERVPADENGPVAESELVLEERTTETSVPVLVVVASLAGAGWLALPLKFLWDERAKRSDNRSQIRNDMLRRIHPLVESYYIPEMNRIHAINESVKKLQHRLTSAGAPAPSNSKPYDKSFNGLLYSIGRFHAFEIRSEGVQLFFRSAAAEIDVRDRLFYLEDKLMDAYGETVGGDILLAQATLTDPTTLFQDGGRGVDFLEFVRRLENSESRQEWLPLGELAQVLRVYCSDPQALAALGRKATKAISAYEDAVSGIYKEWYE